MRNSWLRDAIAQRLKKAAGEAEISGPALAQKLGVSAATVYRWWEGERTPSTALMESYAAAVGKDVSWFYQSADDGQILRDFTDWVLRFAAMVAQGMPADDAYDAVTGQPEELSLRERRAMRSQS